MSLRVCMTLFALFAATFGVAAAGCAAETEDTTPKDRTAPGPTMRPGEQCLSCHRAGGQASRIPWTAAGTVFRSATSNAEDGVEGAIVEIVDSTGKTERLTTNAVGNFYTGTPLTKPLTMSVTFEGKTAKMPIPLNADGACNACHSHPDPIGGAIGRIRIP
ncbi:MAG: hypothetical protein IPK71_11135 [Myxococcales bacterium]|nr:hypothetical protein [Myxococcales bacterium]